MNTVGPYHNRQETYAYFSLPFCMGAKHSIDHYHETLSEALQGVELEFSGYEIDFKGKLVRPTAVDLLQIKLFSFRRGLFDRNLYGGTDRGEDASIHLRC